MTGIPQLDIYDAIGHYTGGGFHPSRYDSAWQLLDGRLKKKGFTGSSFVFYVVYYMNGRPSTELLIRKNQICGRKVWDSFLQHMKTIDSVIESKMKLQRAEIDSLLDYGFTLKRVLLDRRVADLSPALIVDKALESADTFVKDEVLETYLEQAKDLVMGCPSALKDMPHLSKYLEKEG